MYTLSTCKLTFSLATCLSRVMRGHIQLKHTCEDLLCVAFALLHTDLKLGEVGYGMLIASSRTPSTRLEYAKQVQGLALRELHEPQL